MQASLNISPYYDSYCYLPLYVFCGEQLLAAYLRPSKIDGAKHAAAFDETGIKQRRFDELTYGARTWKASQD